MLISNIQRFSLHDGCGIRTTVFVKGCSIRCPWCANPENLLAEKQYYVKTNKCIQNGGQCIINSNCNFLHSASDITQSDYEQCSINAICESGKEWDFDELYKELIKDKIYYDNSGGITFSGGEALLYICQLEPLLRRLSENSINLCVESALFVQEDNVILASRLFNSFIIDIKIIDRYRCNEVLKGNLDLYIKNLDIIFQSKKPVIMRLPVVEGYTDDNGNISNVRQIIKYYKPAKVEIFGVHNLAQSKYEALGMEYHRFSQLPEDKLVDIKNMLSVSGVETEIISI